MKELITKIKLSFIKSHKGEEYKYVVVWWWSIIPYLISYFIIEKIIKECPYRSIDIIISLLSVIYFCWHFYMLRKYSPKKPKLSKQEKKELRAKHRKEMAKKFLRKLFLQEPISKWDTIFMLKVIDVFTIAFFLNYIFIK